MSYGNEQNMGFESSYLYAGLAHQQAWGADQGPLIEYGYEEIKNLTGSASAAPSSYTIDDPGSATAGGSSLRAQGRGVMYQF